MATQTVTKYALRGPAAWITLDSPENRNALSAELVRELAAHVEVALAEPTVRALVLTGQGTAFCAGADLKSRGDMGTGKDVGRNPFAELLQRLYHAPKPVIAAVNGHAFGGGIGLVAAADIAIASERAKFSFSEVRLGLIPAMISVVVLPKLGAHQTMRLFLTGDRFGARDAVGYGLLHRAVADEALESALADEVEAIARGGPIAVAEAKALVRKVQGMPMNEAFAWAEQKIAALFASAEASEGMAAFVSKRPPRWVSDRSGTEGEGR